jgi:hypothetical protein
MYFPQFMSSDIVIVFMKSMKMCILNDENFFTPLVLVHLKVLKLKRTVHTYMSGHIGICCFIKTYSDISLISRDYPDA